MVNKLCISGSGIDGMSHQDILSFITSHFSKDIIDTLNTSQIITDNSVVHIGEYTNPKPRLYSKEDFQMILNSVSDEQKWKILDGVAAGINYGDKIVLYNQDFVSELYSILMGKSLDEAELEYLEGIPYDIIPQTYKIGIIPHEIGHSIYALYVKNTVLQDNRIDITDEFGPMTKYVAEYNKGDNLYYEENFTESLRIYTTNPSYLKKYYPKVHTFIKDKFPYIYQ